MIFDHAVKAIETLVCNVEYGRGYVSLCVVHAVRLPLKDWQLSVFNVSRVKLESARQMKMCSGRVQIWLGFGSPNNVETRRFVRHMQQGTMKAQLKPP
jgi:hypothetical protein